MIGCFFTVSPKKKEEKNNLSGYIEVKGGGPNHRLEGNRDSNPRR